MKKKINLGQSVCILALTTDCILCTHHMLEKKFNGTLYQLFIDFLKAYV
jgi:hypothetical protein